MPTYPTLPTEYASDVEVVDGVLAVRATNGTLKVRRMQTSDKRNFKLVHKLSSAQRTTLLSFYGTNSSTSLDYVFPGDNGTYSVRFLASPLFVPVPGGSYYATVKLGEV